MGLHIRLDLVDILLDRMGPGQKLEKGETCTVEEVMENLIILRRETGESGGDAG